MSFLFLLDQLVELDPAELIRSVLFAACLQPAQPVALEPAGSDHIADVIPKGRGQGASEASDRGGVSSRDSAGIEALPGLSALRKPLG